MSDRATARHRAPQRPLTPLDSLTDQLGTAGRSGAVLAVSTGLVATMGLPAAASGRPAAATQTAVRTTVVTAAATALPASVTGGAAVSAPHTATVDFERAALAVRKTPRKVVQELRTTQRSSRGAERTPSRTATPRPAADPADDAPASRGDVLAVARRYVGTPYVYGGTTPAGFDCSGFISWVLRKVGVNVPRTSRQQYAAARKITRSQAEPGDLVFIFQGGRVTHVGFYLGGNRMIDSPRPGKSVQEREIWSGNIAFGRP